jgi:hypothetical protein
VCPARRQKIPESRTSKIQECLQETSSHRTSLQPTQEPSQPHPAQPQRTSQSHVSRSALRHRHASLSSSSHQHPQQRKNKKHKILRQLISEQPCALLKDNIKYIGRRARHFGDYAAPLEVLYGSAITVRVLSYTSPLEVLYHTPHCISTVCVPVLTFWKKVHDDGPELVL